MKKLRHYGGWCTPLLCNGAMGGVTTKRKAEVTCKRCKDIIKRRESEGFTAVSGEFYKYDAPRAENGESK